MQWVNLLLRYQVGIRKELNKEFLMYCYSIYIINIWFMLTINNPTLMFIYHPCFYHMSILMSFIRTLYHVHVLLYHLSSLFSQSLGLWPHIMWYVMWLQSHTSSLLKSKEKKNQKKRNIKSRKIDKSKIKLLVS